MLKQCLKNGIWHFTRSFLFLIDPETAHSLACIALKGIQALRKTRRKSCIEIHASSSSPFHLQKTNSYSAQKNHSPDPRKLPQAHSVLGLEFSSRIGLAAGFDKNAELLGALPFFGFGFAEIGTVTPRGQPGQSRPRLFREVRETSLFNRMGFNNHGALEVAQNLRDLRPLLPPHFRVGINIGKNKNTPFEEAMSDYVTSTRALKTLADYLVINVSSPNTPQLRLLQSTKTLKPLIESVLEECVRSPSPGQSPPVLLKLSPDLSPEDMASILTQASSWGLSGWVLTNTLPGEIQTPHGSFQGGWSGGKLTHLSRERLKLARSLTSLPIISVGGILDEAEAQSRIQLGADLIQIYTGWIYGGPFFPKILDQAIQETTRGRSNSIPTSPHGPLQSRDP